MRILFLTFYYEPDLCAGSFRNTPLSQELSKQLNDDDQIHIVTTFPNRYNSYNTSAVAYEEQGNIKIQRIEIPVHKSGFMDQILSFKKFFFETLKLTRNEDYNLVFASSSRLFTAFLGGYIARTRKIGLYLDIRDIFSDTIKDVLKKKILQIPLLVVLKGVEKYTFSYANHINLVSEGFRPYFERSYLKPNYSYFTNGIDTPFLTKFKKNYQVKRNLITYAGNIGEGQGLEKIIPYAAQKLVDYRFRIIGDGGTRHLLEKKIQDLKLTNVQILNPLSRNELILHYQESDYLFLHLNDYKAFLNVLPSKIFEYAAFDVPIIAGVSGFASKFIENNIENYILFRPGDVEAFVSQVQNFIYRREERSNFKAKFSRNKIMEMMATNILSYL